MDTFHLISELLQWLCIFQLIAFKRNKSDRSWP